MTSFSINGSSFQSNEGKLTRLFPDQNNFIKFQYDLEKLNFPEIVKEILEINDYNNYQLQKTATFSGAQTPQTQAHTLFYNALNNRSTVGKEFLEKYMDLLYIIKNDFTQFNFIYQTIPSFRVQLPDNIAVKAHTDYNSDPSSGHKLPQKCVSFFLPFTSAKDSTSIQIPNNQRIEANPGEVVIWDGANTLHWNEKNETNHPRFSMDFKILPTKYYDPNTKATSLNESVPFLTGYGNYFENF